MSLSVAEQLTQLDAARQLVLQDSGLYPQIVQGILPIVGANARLELRRWGADFLAETFASPLLVPQEKERLSIFILQTLKELLENQGEDNNVIKSVIQAAASIYALVFRYMYVHYPPIVRPSTIWLLREALGYREEAGDIVLRWIVILESQTNMTRQHGTA